MKYHAFLGAAALIVSLGIASPAIAADTSSLAAAATVSKTLFAAENIVPWCIVPYDSLNRKPAERIAMLKRLGFTQYAWDWRDRHLADFPEEIRLAKAAGLRISAVWCWIDGRSDRPGELSASNRALLQAIREGGLATELWVGINSNYFAGVPEAELTEHATRMVTYLRDEMRATGGTVALYNHGGWFGEPENQLRIIERLGDPSVGIVYNLHHAEGQLERFGQLVELMKPHLRCINLNGLRPGARDSDIITLGEGTLEAEFIGVLARSGYRGRIGILGHTEGEDVEQVLRRNRDGLARIVSKL